MSVAFTKEEDYEAAAAHLPDLPVSPHPNLVTASGLAQIEARLAEARAAYAAAQGGDVKADRTALARATRDLRYWSARRGSAQLTPRDPARPGAQFGDRVRFARADGRTQAFRIVGEDEADPKAGAISYASPHPWPAPSSAASPATRSRARKAPWRCWASRRPDARGPRQAPSAGARRGAIAFAQRGANTSAGTVAA